MKIRLAIMMFLQFFIWGSWYNTIGLWMGKVGMGDGVSWTYTVGPIAVAIAPFFGMLVDRFFNTERFLSFSFIVAGLIIGCTPHIAGPGKENLFNTFIFFHMLFYMPTLALTASLSFRHLKNSAREFPVVRVLGTIGWIAGASTVSVATLGDMSFIGDDSHRQLYLAAGSSILLGLYCLSLPKTPPPSKGEPINKRDLLFLDVWALFKKPSFAVFIVSSFLVCIPLAAYFMSLQNMMHAMEISHIGAKKVFGQYSEIIFMLLMPLIYRKLGVKKLILLGILAWIVRYALFAMGASQGLVSLVMIGILLHGICYDFFFVTGMIYVDESTPARIRGQAQSCLVFFTQSLGLGLGAQFVGSKLAPMTLGGNVYEAGTPDKLALWPNFWWILAGIACVVLIIFLVIFKEEPRSGDSPSADSGLAH
jgi:nucleoside transporter